MTPARSSICSRLPAVLAAGAVICLAGCHAIDFYDRSLEAPVPSVMEPPREKAKVALPAYRIEPPDILQIEVLKLVPLPPYRAEVYDVLQVTVVGTLPGQPIGPRDRYGNPTANGGLYLVEAEGTVDLGPAYGKVRVAGMTIEEVNTAVTKHLRQLLVSPEVSVQLARTAGTQPITGQYLVGPDGTVNLRQYGLVHVAGKTIVQATQALHKHLSQFFDSPEVAVDVAAYNSKVYYIITEGAGLGDNVTRVPVTGSDTVLDAVSRLGGLSQMSSTEIWIARPAPGGFGCEQILPVDWDAVTRGALTATNYQLMPGDRVFIAEDGVHSLTNFLAKMTSPLERIIGITSLGANTIRSMQTFGRGFQLRRGRAF